MYIFKSFNKVITVVGKSVMFILRSFRFLIFLVGAISIGTGAYIYHQTHQDYVPPPVTEVSPQIAEIYSRIKAATDQSAKIPPIYQLTGLYSVYVPNAMVDNYAIYITYRLQVLLKDNPDALALIIGHEIAHSLLHHTKGYNIYTRDSSATDELLSDGYGAFLATKAGYNVCKGAEFFLVMKELYGDNLDSSHPSNIFRYAHLQMDHCK